MQQQQQQQHQAHTGVPKDNKEKKDKEYTNAFIHSCMLFANSIRQNKPIVKCLHILIQCAIEHSKISPHDGSKELTPANYFEPLWFVYYMFFAIHNPKLEEYINRKHRGAAITRFDGTTKSKQQTEQHQHHPAIYALHIVKNMLRCRKNTSNIVFNLYDYGYKKLKMVTHLYNIKRIPKSKMQPTPTTTVTMSQTSHNHHHNHHHNHNHNHNHLIKSYDSGHLYTTSVMIKRLYETSDDFQDNTYRMVIEHIVQNQDPLLYTTDVENICDKMKKITYERKDIILLALVSYMKIAENDINKQSLFISLTDAEITLTNSELDTFDSKPESKPDTNPDSKVVTIDSNILILSSVDEKYKYLLS